MSTAFQLPRAVGNAPVWCREHFKADGRMLRLYGHTPHSLDPLTEETEDLPHGGEIRHHPLRDEWNVYAAHRQNRTFKPAASDDPLAPSKSGGPPTEVPFEDFELAIFDNKFAAFHPRANEAAELAGVDIAPARGKCEVVIYGPEAEGNLHSIGQDRRRILLSALLDRYESLFATGCQYVLPFENRGDEVGVTLHHPHGQIYGFERTPRVQQRAVDAFASGYDLAAEITAAMPDAVMRAMKPRLDQSMPVGNEGAGVVVKAGDSPAAQALMGKTVAMLGGDMYATYRSLNVAQCMELPDSVTPREGASCFVNPLTAYVMTREVLKIPRGGWLLVTAAGSALGKSVVRLGQHYGFKTVCVVRSGSNSEELRRLGADAVVDTSQQNPVEEVFRITRGKGVGHAIDCVGGELTAEVVRCLGLGGKLVLYGTLGNSPLQLPVRDLMMPVAQISGFILPNWMLQQSPLTLLRVLHTVKRLTLKGVFTSRVSATFPLGEVADALAAATLPGRTGKVMLRIAPP